MAFCKESVEFEGIGALSIVACQEHLRRPVMIRSPPVAARRAIDQRTAIDSLN